MLTGDINQLSEKGKNDEIGKSSVFKKGNQFFESEEASAIAFSYKIAAQSYPEMMEIIERYQVDDSCLLFTIPWWFKNVEKKPEEGNTTA